VETASQIWRRHSIKCLTGNIVKAPHADSYISMELSDGAADTVHPEVRAHIGSLVSAVSHRS
jgi:hypothetical protein